jgi:hypothetical protein
MHDWGACTPALASPHTRPSRTPHASQRRYELHIREIHLLDWYGGVAVVTAEQYFAAGGSSSTDVGQQSAAATGAAR